jgi:hypothetical protein
MPIVGAVSSIGKGVGNSVASGGTGGGVGGAIGGGGSQQPVSSDQFYLGNGVGWSREGGAAPYAPSASPAPLQQQQTSPPPAWTGWNTQSSIPQSPSRPMGWSSPSYNSMNDPNNPASAPARAAWDQAQFMASPSMQQLQNQTLTAWAQANLGMAGYDAQRRYMLGDYNSDMSRNNLAMQGLGLDRQDLGTNRSRVGLDINGRQVDRGYIGEMQGLADRSLANQIGTIDQNLGADIRNRNSDYTGRGAWFAPFRGIENKESTLAAGRERDMAQISRSERESGWQRDLRHLDIGDQRSQLDYQDLGSAEARLDLEAQNLGLDRGDLERGLQQGLEALGLSQNMTVIDLFSMLNSNDAQQQQLAIQIAQDAYARFMFGSNNPGAMTPFGDGLATQQGRTP